MDHPILARRPDPRLIDKKKRTYLVDFGIPADHKGKIKKSKKRQITRPCNFYDFSFK